MPKDKVVPVRRNGKNRFCIVLQSEKPIDDMAWATWHIWLNMPSVCRLSSDGIEAHLEELKCLKKKTR